MTVKKFDVMKQIEAANRAALLAIGEKAQDALFDNTVKVTGALANSWNYSIDNYDSPFGTGQNSGEALTEEQHVSKPDQKDAVRVGSNLRYAEPYNRRKKVMEQMADVEQSQFGKIAEAAYKKVIGT